MLLLVALLACLGPSGSASAARGSVRQAVLTPGVASVRPFSLSRVLVPKIGGLTDEVDRLAARARRSRTANEESRVGLDAAELFGRLQDLMHDVAESQLRPGLVPAEVNLLPRLANDVAGLVARVQRVKSRLRPVEMDTSFAGAGVPPPPMGGVPPPSSAGGLNTVVSRASKAGAAALADDERLAGLARLRFREGAAGCTCAEHENGHCALSEEEKVKCSDASGASGAGPHHGGGLLQNIMLGRGAGAKHAKGPTIIVNNYVGQDEEGESGPHVEPVVKGAPTPTPLPKDECDCKSHARGWCALNETMMAK